MAGKDTGGCEGHGNLVAFIEKETLECLNQCDTHPVADAFDGQPNTWLQSDPDTDTQLLLSVGFRVPVKISCLKITLPEGAAEDDAPVSVKLFIGKDDSIDFDEAESRVATQELEVMPGEEMPVKFVKFQNVKHIRAFVPGSRGGDVTKICSMQFIGIPGEAMDMKDWKPIKG
jgi:hypothetical protein